MTLDQQEKHLENLEQDADLVAEFLSSLDTCRLHIIGHALNNELALRCEGKPDDARLLH